MPRIVSNHQLLWDYLQGNIKFTDEYSQLIIHHTNPNKFQGEFTPLSYALSQNNVVAARAMLKSPEFLAQDDQLEGLAKAMVIALNSDNDEIKKIGEEILEQYGLICDDAFTLGKKRYTPLSYIIEYKRESFDIFFAKQKKSIHTKRLAVEKALELEQLTIAEKILTAFKNAPQQKIYDPGQLSPLADLNNYGKYNDYLCQLFIDNGADPALLLFEAIKRGDKAQVTFLVSKDVDLSTIVWVEEHKMNMSISSYVVREKPDILGAVLEGVKIAPSAKLVSAGIAAINAGKVDMAKQILDAYFSHPVPIFDSQKEILIFLKFCIEQNLDTYGELLLKGVPETDNFIEDSDDTFFSYVIKNHPDWIERILKNEHALQKIRHAKNRKLSKPELIFGTNILFALRVAFEVNRIDVFENILKLRAGLSEYLAASLDASCSRVKFQKLFDLVATSNNLKFKQLLLDNGANSTPSLRPKAVDPGVAVAHYIGRMNAALQAVNIAFQAGNIALQVVNTTVYIELLRKRPSGCSLVPHIKNALQTQNADLLKQLLPIMDLKEVYDDIEQLLITALNNNIIIIFIINLINQGIDIHYRFDIEKGNTSILGFLIQNNQFQSVNIIFSIPYNWNSRRAYWAVSAAIVKGRLDIVDKIIDRCSENTTLMAPKNLNDPIHDAAYQAAIRGYYPLVLKLVARGAYLDLAIIFEKNSGEDFEKILTALQGEALEPIKVTLQAIKANNNKVVGLLLSHPIVNQQLNNKDNIMSLLSTAIEQENLEAAQLILDKYKNKICFNEKMMRLFLLCAQGKEPEHESIALQLLAQHSYQIASLEGLVMSFDLWTLDDKTALEIAAETGKVNLVNELIQHYSSNPHLKRVEQQPMALSLALQNRHFPVVKVITIHAANALNNIMIAPFKNENFSQYNSHMTSSEGSDSESTQVHLSAHHFK